MQSEALPISDYVVKTYMSKSIQKYVEQWRVEPEAVIELLVEHFRDMGIYFVSHKHERIMKASMIHQLRHSPDIAVLVKQAAKDELLKKKTRHSD